MIKVRRLVAKVAYILNRFVVTELPLPLKYHTLDNILKLGFVYVEGSVPPNLETRDINFFFFLVC